MPTITIPASELQPGDQIDAPLQLGLPGVSRWLPSEAAFTGWFHRRNNFDYGECDHGTYQGGPLNGEPYAMCERQAKGLIEWLGAPQCSPTEDELVQALGTLLHGVGLATSDLTRIARNIAGLYAAQPTLVEVRDQIAGQVETWINTPPRNESFEDPELVAFIRGDETTTHKEAPRG